MTSGSAEAQRRESRYAHPSLPTPPTSPVLAPAFQSETDRLTKTVVRDGNSITFMPSGEESYAKRWELIEGAEKSLHMVSFSVIKDDTSRRLVLRMAQLSREGRLEPFVSRVADDPEFDEDTRSAIAELAGDEAFLLAVEDYLGRTRVVH